MIKSAKILSTVFLLTVLFCRSSWATSVLNKVTLTDESSRLQIFLRFSESPSYTMKILGKRVDLLLRATVPAGDFTDLPGNDKMIKMISKTYRDHLRVSFYFRYPPQNVNIRQSKETSSLMLDILVGNPFSALYPDLSARLHGLTVLNRNEIDFTNPLYASPYGDNWKLFIEKYESAVIVQPEQLYSLPPFPLAASIKPRIAVEQWLPDEIMALSKTNDWPMVSTALKDQLELEKNEEYRNRLLMTYAESLVRNNQYQEPYKLLQQISFTYPDSPLDTYAKLLLIYLTAIQEDPYLAKIKLEQFTKQESDNTPFASYINIFQAELALTTGRIKDAVTILKLDTIAYTGTSELLRLLRQADSYFDKGDPVKALVAYKKLDEQSDIVKKHPASLARYSDSLYTHGRFKEAAENYQPLVDLLTDTKIQHLAMFRLAMSRLHSGTKWTRVFPLFARIQNTFPGTEGAYRARLKQTDMHFLSGKTRDNRVAQNYGQLGLVANRVELREEALVKQAMVNALAGNHELSIQQAMGVLRDFQHGELITEARALILSQLSGVLQNMIANEKYVAALVLAKKNRFFFARGWLNVDLLYDLAEAYVQLGVYDRAVRAYLYILEVSTEEEREKVYKPLLTALYESGKYALIEDYADRYFFRYADSPGAADIFLIRIKALQKNNKVQLAASLLDAPDSFSTPEINRTASRIYFELHQWDKVITLVNSEKLSSGWSGGERDYLLAESLFQSGQYAKAKPVFERLQEEEPYIELAMFRLAEIDLKDGDSESALKQFQKLTEKGKDPRWIKMAREEIGILRLKGINL